MRVIMFKPRFADLVRSGAKTQTIRPPRKRCLHHGEIVSLRMWSELPYRSPQVELGRGIITDAEADGFTGLKEFVDWFDQTHGLPFTGVLIKWRIKHSAFPIQ